MRVSKALEMPMLFLMDLDKGALRSEKPRTRCKTKPRNASFMGPEPQPQQDHSVPVFIKMPALKTVFTTGKTLEEVVGAQA